MIKFFRKIRQKLLKENRVTRYLVYALGEIVLVVIGILIALSINTWNENRKDRAMEANYLKGISENLEGNISELEALILDEDIQSPKVKEFANRAGYIKALTLAKRRDRIKLLTASRVLKEEIQNYLSHPNL
ncbi:hypothetical protein EF405_08100 [Cyclobacteriaceae bacterium YHN15]|nr:hypothetical protein EF405_08100 [Cyclobacteriaceae bacterium YHN15]